VRVRTCMLGSESWVVGMGECGRIWWWRYDVTKYELASFMLKLLGVYALIEALPLLRYLGIIASMFGSDDMSQSLWLYLGMTLPFIFTALVGLALLMYSDALAGKIFGRDDGTNVSTAIRGAEFQAIGFSVVAVFVALQAVPQVLQLVTNIWHITSKRFPEDVDARLVYGTWKIGLSVVLQYVLAVVLFLRARGLANLWHKMQVARYVKVGDNKQSVDTDVR